MGELARGEGKRPEISFAIVACLMVVFAADCLTPLGWVEWIFYVAPVGMCLFLPAPLAPLRVAAACSVLLVVGFFISPPGGLREVAIANRTFGFVVLWTVAGLTRQVVTSRLELGRQQWLRSAHAEVSSALRGEVTLKELGERVLGLLAARCSAQVGAFYVLEQGVLSRQASFALEAEAPERFRLGEGLVGQTARSARRMVLTTLPEGYLRVSSALGKADSRRALLAPLKADSAVVGVMELGFFGSDTRDAETLIEQLEEPIGISVRSAVYRSQLEALLTRSQLQAGELQAQQEELRVSNEELEEQGRVLREQQTHLEQQQADLEQINVRLEEHTELLTQRQADLLLAQRDLAEKARELEIANRYKSEFLANMSHELRTPLNSALILAKLLADNPDGNLSSEQCRYASSIYSAGNDLLDLINDILDLSKIEAGQVQLRTERVPLDAMLASVERMFQPVATQRGLELYVESEADVPEQILTDPQRLQQVLRNLMSNALKFTERGAVRLRVRRAGARHVEVAVSDTGLGIPESQLEVIFEAFRQADGTTSRRFGGTGLGLSISRQLATLLGGDLTVASQPGEGSTFTLRIPIEHRSEERAAQAEEPTLRESSERASRASGRASARAEQRREGRASRQEHGSAPPPKEGERPLLIIEDDPEFRSVLADLARGRGYWPMLASSADDGVELALAHLPVAVVLDLGLPDHPGLSVLDRLKRDSRTRHIPIQIISAHEHTREALEMGAAGYLLKPVRPEQLSEAFDRLERRGESSLRRVLIVEDDERQQESISALLKADDVVTKAARNVRDALDELHRATYDCVVLDLQLPDGTGIELLERMSQGDDVCSFPPVIVYTGKEISPIEEDELRRFSSSIIIKGARSPERLLDEVTLFLHQVETKLPPERQRMLAQARSRDALFEGRRILLVEDDVRNVFALTGVLEPRGALLRTARNGREAIELLAQDPNVDMILMDIMMPEMDGYTAMQELRSQQAFVHTPIIALTAKAMRDDLERCLAAGANDYIAKPIDIDKLLSLLRVWMPKRGSG